MTPVVSSEPAEEASGSEATFKRMRATGTAVCRWPVNAPRGPAYERPAPVVFDPCEALVDLEAVASRDARAVPVAPLSSVASVEVVAREVVGAVPFSPSLTSPAAALTSPADCCT